MWSYIVLFDHNDTQHSVGLLYTGDRPVVETLPGNTQHSRETDIHTPPAGFEPAIPESERPHTHALDSAATGIGFVITRSSCYSSNKRLRFATVRGI
jgi:hypothetical protein